MQPLNSIILAPKAVPILSILIALSATINCQSLDNSTQNAAQNQDAESNSGRALSPVEWTARYTCEALPARHLQQPSGSNLSWYVESLSASFDACTREPTSWRWLYIDELMPGKNSLIIKEDSLDERLANVVHLSTSSNRFTDSNYFEFNSGDSNKDSENIRLVAGPQVDDKLCKLHLDQMLALQEELDSKLDWLRRGTTQSNNLSLSEDHIRLARVLDSFGRYESGLLLGGTKSGGSFELCVKSQLSFQNQVATDMRFCWAKLSISRHLSKPLRERQRFSFESGQDYNLTGICVPSSCHSININRHKDIVGRLVSTQFKLPKTIYLDETLELDNVFCLVDEESNYNRLPTSGRIFLLVLFVWLACAMFVTYKLNFSKATKQNGNNRSFWDRFAYLDLIISWQDLFGKNDAIRNSTTTRQINLDALNPIKVLCVTYVVFGHSTMLGLSSAQDTAHAYTVFEISKFFWFGMNGFVVELTFVLTSLSMTYLVLSKLNAAPIRRSNSARFLVKNWFAITSLRYLRLLPMLLVVHCLVKSIFPFVGPASPNWDFGLNKDTITGACVHSESWLAPLEGLFSFRSSAAITRQCLVTTWSVQVDLILVTFVITPLVLLISLRKLKLALSLAVGLVAMSLYESLNVYLNADWAAAIWETKELRVHGFFMATSGFSQLRTSTCFYTPCALAGLFAGYQLFKLEQTKRKSTGSTYFPSSTIAVKLAFAAVALNIVLSTLVPYFKRIGTPNSPETLLIYLTLSRTLVSAGYATVLMYLTTTSSASKWKNLVYKILFQGSLAQFWRTLSKLGYAIILTHWQVLIYVYGSTTNDFKMANWNHVYAFAATYMYCLPISVALFVLVENPLDKLIRERLSRKQEQTN